MTLAFLIMDDGGWVSGSKSVRISTNNFTLQEVQLLSQMFKTRALPVIEPPPPALQNPSLRLDSSFFFFLLLLLLANGCSLMHRFFAPPHGGRGKLKIKNDGGIIYIYIYIMYSVTSPRRGDGNTPDKYSIYIKVASLPFFYHELSLWDNTFMYIYMSSHARFVWVGLMAHALKTVRMHRTI